jgi:hypothetical protein
MMAKPQLARLEESRRFASDRPTRRIQIVSLPDTSVGTQGTSDDAISALWVDGAAVDNELLPLAAESQLSASKLWNMMSDLLARSDLVRHNT